MSDGTTLSWNGMTWTTDFNPPPGTGSVPATAQPPAQPQNLWIPSNASVVNGNLQLTIQRNSGWIWSQAAGWQQATPNEAGQNWAASEVELQLPAGQQLTYGTFCVTVIAGTPETPAWPAFTGPCTASTAETNTIFGAFTFDPAATATSPFGEIDIVEIGYQAQNQATGWINEQPGGPVADSDAQHCVQPWDPVHPGVPDWNNIHRITLDPASIPSSGEVTFAAIWSENAPVQFYAAYGAFSASTFPFVSAPFSWTSGVNGPVPTSTMSFFMNLWPYGGPSTGVAQTFTVTSVDVPMTAVTSGG